MWHAQLILASVLTALYESVSILLRYALAQNPVVSFVGASTLRACPNVNAKDTWSVRHNGRRGWNCLKTVVEMLNPRYLAHGWNC